MIIGTAPGSTDLGAVGKTERPGENRTIDGPKGGGRWGGRPEMKHKNLSRRSFPATDPAQIPVRNARWSLVLSTVLVLLSIPGFSARAAIWDPVDGLIDLTAVQSEVNGNDEQTLRQEYSAHVGFTPLPYVKSRAAFRYLKFDQEIDAALGSYREEILPSAEVRWHHPWLTVLLSGQQRRVRPQFSSGRLITDLLQGSLKTRDSRYPILGLQYQDSHSYTERIADENDIRSRRIQFTADGSRGEQHASYAYSHQKNDNVISGLESTYRQHTLRWTGGRRNLADGRLDLTGSCQSNYGTQTSEVATGDAVRDQLPVAAALHALDDAPEFGALEELPGLADGDTETPVLPRIDLGGGVSDHNLGADLGMKRPVSAIYVYTDRPSGTGVRWRVYWSDDNVNWEDWSAAPAQRFNSLLNRYEIEFPVVSKRYFKVVAGGMNDIAEVYATELEIFEDLVTTKSRDRIRSSHQADLRGAYRIDDRWSTVLGASYGADRTHHADDARQRFSYAWNLRYEPSPRQRHHLRWEQSWQDYENAQADLRNETAAYTAILDPLPTLRATASVSDRMTYEDSRLAQDALGTTLNAEALWVPGLTMKAGAGLSRYRNFSSDHHYLTGVLSSGILAALTSTLDLSVDWRFQESRDRRTDDLTTRRSLNVGIEYQVTRKLYFRGSLRLLSEFSDSRVEDYLLSWNLTSTLRISAQSYTSDGEDFDRTERQSVNVNYDLGTRSSLYARIAEVDLSEGGGNRTLSFQQGFRMGF